MTTHHGSNRYSPRVQLLGTAHECWQHYPDDVCGLVDSATERVAIGATTMFSASEKLRLVGGFEIDSPTLGAYLEMRQGSAAAVAPASSGRIRYNETLQRWEASENTGAYFPLAAPAAGGWIDDGAIVHTVTATDSVVIGAAAIIGAERFRLTGGTAIIDMTSPTALQVGPTGLATTTFAVNTTSALIGIGTNTVTTTSLKPEIVINSSHPTVQWRMPTFSAVFAGTTDYVFQIGWNVDDGGGPVDPAEPVLRDAWESAFNNGAAILCERFWEYGAAGGAGPTRRPVGCTVNRATHDSQVAIVGQLTVSNSASTAQRLIINEGAAGVDVIAQFGSIAGGASQIVMGKNNVVAFLQVDSVGANAPLLRLDASDVLQICQSANAAQFSGNTTVARTSTTAFRVGNAGLAPLTIVADTTNNRVGIGAAPGAFTLDVTGDTRITGKLTVTGAIDPTSLTLSGGTAQFVQWGAGSTAPVSAATSMRVRYEEGTNVAQISLNGAAYVTLATAAGGAPADAPYLTDGSVSGLSNERNILALTAPLFFANSGLGAVVANFTRFEVANSTVLESLSIRRAASGGAGANGIGSALGLWAETTTNDTYGQAVLLEGTLTDAAVATLTGTFGIRTPSGGPTAVRVLVDGPGHLMLGDNPTIQAGNPRLQVQSMSAGDAVFYFRAAPAEVSTTTIGQVLDGTGAAQITIRADGKSGFGTTASGNSRIRSQLGQDGANTQEAVKGICQRNGNPGAAGAVQGGVFEAQALTTGADSAGTDLVDVFIGAVAQALQQSTDVLGHSGDFAGMFGLAQHDGAGALGTITNAIGVKGRYGWTSNVTLSPAITTGIALLAASPVRTAGTGTATTGIGVKVRNQGAAFVTTAIGVDVDTISGSGTNIGIRSQSGIIVGASGFLGAELVRLAGQSVVDVSSTTAFRVGSASLATTTVIVDTTNRRMAVGAASAPDSTLNVFQLAASTGSPLVATLTGAAHTTLTASVEAIDLYCKFARAVQFNTGALTNQRAALIEAPTYAFVAASTITNGATLAVQGPPISSTNATITNSAAIWIQNAPTGTINNAFGLRIANMGNVGGATAAYGIDIETQSGSATNIGLRTQNAVLVGASALLGSERLRVTGATAIVDFTSTTSFQVTQTGGGGPALVVDTTNTRVGVGAAPGAFTLDVNGAARIQGKLTVTGSLDPTDLILSGGGTAHFIQWGAGSTAAVSAATTMRFRYEEGTNVAQISLNGAAYVTLATAAGGAPADAPYLTNGAVTGLSAEVNVQAHATPLFFQPSANSTTAWQLRNAAGAVVFDSDSTNRRVGINATPTATLDVTQIAVSAVAPPTAVSVTLGAHTALTAGTSFYEIDLNTGASSAQFTTGALIAEAFTVRIRPRTYTATAATQTITKAVTLALTGEPTASTNVAFTESYTLDVNGRSNLFADRAGAASDFVGVDLGVDLLSGTQTDIFTGGTSLAKALGTSIVSGTGELNGWSAQANVATTGTVVLATGVVGTSFATGAGVRTVTTQVAVDGEVGYDDDDGLPTAGSVITNATIFRALPTQNVLAGTRTITTLRGFHAANLGVAGITTSIVIDIEAQSGATNNRGIRVAGPDSAQYAVELTSGRLRHDSAVAGTAGIKLVHNVVTTLSGAESGGTVSLAGSVVSPGAVTSSGTGLSGLQGVGGGYEHRSTGTTAFASGVTGTAFGAGTGLALGASMTELAGVSGVSGYLTSDLPTSGTIANATCLNAEGIFSTSAGARLVTTGRGVRVKNQGGAGVTNAYGIDVEAQSGAITTNIGIRSQSALLIGNASLIGAELVRLAGTTIVDVTSTTAFRVATASLGATLITADTTNTRVGIGIAPTGGILHVEGSDNLRLTTAANTEGMRFFPTGTTTWRWEAIGTVTTQETNMNVLVAGNGRGLQFEFGLGGIIHSQITGGTLGSVTHTQVAVTSGTYPVAWTATLGAHTTLTVSDSYDYDINGARTVQFTTGAAITEATVFRIRPATYAGTAVTQTVTAGATLILSGTPAAGTNGAVTTSSALLIQNGSSGAGVTNKIGIDIVTISGASTQNLGIRTQGAVVVAATGVSGTEAARIAGGGLLVDGNQFVVSVGVGPCTINNSASAISIGNNADAFAVNVGTGAAQRTITIGNATSATSVVINAGTGNIDIGTGGQARTTRLATGAAIQTVTIGSSNSTSTLTLDAGTGLLAIGLSAACPISIGSAGGDHTITIGSSDCTTVGIQAGTGGTASLFTAASAVTVNMATGAAVKTVTIGSTNTTSSLKLDSGTGNIDIGIGAQDRAINIGTALGVTQTVTVGSKGVASVLTLDAGTGNIIMAALPCNIAMFGAGSFGSGTGVLSVINAGTNPTVNPVGGGILYSNAGAGTWRGSGGTVTAFGPAGPHCGECGYDAWRVASVNENWKSWHFECSHCGAEYKGGPQNVFELLSDEQKHERLHRDMDWDDVAHVMKLAA